MSFLSAHEDFVQRTLAALDNIWKRLLFTGALRDGTGDYHHWGLEREHGAVEARSAIERAHSELIFELVEMSMDDAVRNAERMDGILPLRVEMICPTYTQKCLRQHVDYVLETTRLILEAQEQHDHQAA